MFCSVFQNSFLKIASFPLAVSVLLSQESDTGKPGAGSSGVMGVTRVLISLQQ